MIPSLSPLIQLRKRVINDCFKLYSLPQNLAYQELLPLDVIPSSSSKKLAILLMTYKREATTNELAKISNQSAALIRELRKDGFEFQGDSRHPFLYKNKKGETCRRIIGVKEPKAEIKTLAKSLIDKSIAACLSAIEIYNKPDFKYREEIFSVLAVNAWELLLKAKIITENGNNVESIWQLDKDGAPIVKAGMHQTIGIFEALQKLNSEKILNKDCCKNLEGLIEIRNASIHFINKSPELAQNVQEFGMACLLNYVVATSEWFERDLSSYSFFLMPMSFFYPSELEKSLFSENPKEVSKLLRFLEKAKASSSLDSNSKYLIFQKITFGFTRSETRESDLTAKTVTADADVSVKMDEESFIETYYPLEYEKIIEHLRKKIQRFKVNDEFRRTMRELESDGDKFCKPKYRNHRKKTGNPKKWYSPKILEALYKHYSNS